MKKRLIHSSFRAVKIATCIALCLVLTHATAQTLSDSLKSANQQTKNLLKYSLNKEGTHYFQVTFLNQTWTRFNESNDSSLLFGKNAANTFDIGLRRTRIQMFGQVNDRAFIYFQFGQNNFNNAYNYTSNRKLAAFFHDAVCEYKVSRENQLKIGAGLTVMNGLSRFSQPSVSTILTLDVPVFLQYTVDQIDQFDRKLSIYFRGQPGKFDYRFYISDPFPVNSNGSVPPAISKDASFVNFATFPAGKSPGIHYQCGGYLAYNFFEKENHTTPYMNGTYLGSKKIWNIAAGLVYQKNSLWYLSPENGAFTDTTFADMLHWSLETFLDIPLNKEQKSALNFFAGYYNTNYGNNYLRYNGIMNPATGSSAKTMLQSNAYGNAFPMFGTGHVAYCQAGILLPKNLLGEQNGQLLLYGSSQYDNLQALNHKPMLVFDSGINWLVSGHNTKITLNYQNRPTFYLDGNGNVNTGKRKSCFVLQYQIYI